LSQDEQSAGDISEQSVGGNVEIDLDGVPEMTYIPEYNVE
jgi:hypothetical protein